MDLEPIVKVSSTQSAPEISSAPKKMETPHKDVVEESAPVREPSAPRKEEESKGGEPGKEKKEHVVSEAAISDAVRNANHKIKMTRTRCEYAYHKETNRVSIKVFDEDTDEMIREIPPEKSLDMLQKMWEMAGILIDERK